MGKYDSRGVGDERREKRRAADVLKQTAAVRIGIQNQKEYPMHRVFFFCCPVHMFLKGCLNEAIPLEGGGQMDPLGRWDEWEWEKAAHEIGRSSRYDSYRRENPKGKRLYFADESVKSFADKWTASQKRVVLSALLLLSIVFSSKGEDFVSRNVYAFYKTGMGSGNLYTSLNTMAKEVIGISDDDSMEVDVPVQGIFYPPVAGTVRVGFHGRNYAGGISNGIEIESNLGTAVFCPKEGVVMGIDKDPAIGPMIRFNFGDGWEGIVGNLGEINVGKGEPVSSGAKIGTVGISGERQKPWLYFELRHNGKPVNPLNYLIQNQ